MPIRLDLKARHGSPAWRVANLLSQVMHPFLIAPLGMFLILWLDRVNVLSALAWTTFCSAIVILPAALHLHHKVKAGEYSDADVSVREERRNFYLFGAFAIAVGFATLLILRAPYVLVASFATAIVTALVFMLTNHTWTKISVHAGVFTGVTTCVAFFSWQLAAGLLAVSWARIALGRHTLLQVLLAWLIAAACVLAVFGPLQSIRTDPVVRTFERQHDAGSQYHFFHRT